MSIKVNPLGDRILVKPQEKPNTSEGGIFLPETAGAGSPHWGKVMRCGPGKQLDNGSTRTLTVKEGDTIIFGEYAGTKVKVGVDEMLFMREEDVMAIAE